MTERLLPASPQASTAPRWLWPIRVPGALGPNVLRYALALGDWLGPWHRWVLAGAFIGAAPLALGTVAPWQILGLITAIGLAPLFAAAILRDRAGLGMAAVGVAFFLHNAIAIALTADDPQRAAALFSAGGRYWQETRQWIVSGESPEYRLGYWLPGHIGSALVMAAFTYLSLGFVTLWHGFYEVDLMNCYVGHLLHESGNPAIILLLGWHPWSMCRGIGFLFLTSEALAFSLERLTGVQFSTPKGRWRRVFFGLFFLVLDAVVKYLFLEAVRVRLFAALNGSG